MKKQLKDNKSINMCPFSLVVEHCTCNAEVLSSNLREGNV